jgi:hypothetical protein
MLSVTSTLAVSQSLTARWGLQSDVLYEEALEPPGQTSVVKSNSRQRPSIRTFRVRDPQYEQTLLPFLQRHTILTNLYLETHTSSGTYIPQADFAAWATRRDPSHVADGISLAPVLYFDFIGATGKLYVLDRIIVQTISFEEYRGGGGFIDDKAWYDLELRTTPGSKTYQVDDKLRFVGTGRAEIRFWSGNYYPSAALSNSLYPPPEVSLHLTTARWRFIPSARPFGA